MNKTVTTGAGGVIQIDNLAPGVYTVTEQSYDKYEPQEVRRVTVVSGQVATVNFNNTLKRGTLIVTKTSEDGLNEGMKFHLYGTSLSGLAVDEYAVTDSTGKAVFSDVLIGTGYTLEEVDTAIRYVVPAKQTAAVEWNTVTNKSFTNILKKWNVTVTKSDAETGMPQGDATLAGAVYGIYKGDQLVDTYTTDANGQFITKYYVCGDDWIIREITPSEGYLLDSSVYPIGAEAKNYAVEYNTTANDVTEQIIKGRIAIIKHTDDGETQLETPETGAKFAVFLKAAGFYDNAKASERDYLICDENGYAVTKDLPTASTRCIRPRAGTAVSCLPISMCISPRTGRPIATLPTTAILKAILRSSRWMPKRARSFRWRVQASGSTARTGRSSRRLSPIPQLPPSTPFIPTATAILSRPKSWNTARAIRWWRFPHPTATR